MKRASLICCILFLMSYSAFSQEFSVELGQSFTTFDYKNSNNQTLDNLQANNTNYFAIGYRGKLTEKTLNYTIDGGLRNYRTSGSDATLNSYYSWETTYLSFLVGLDIEAVKLHKLSAHIFGNFGPEFLVKGTQTINNQVFDLRKVENFEKTLYFARAGLGLEYKVSNGIGLAVRYNFGKSTYSSSGSTSDTSEKLRFKTDDVSLKLYFNLFPNNQQ